MLTVFALQGESALLLETNLQLSFSSITVTIVSLDLLCARLSFPPVVNHLSWFNLIFDERKECAIIVNAYF
jgi:hypothetical protein